LSHSRQPGERMPDAPKGEHRAKAEERCG